MTAKYKMVFDFAIAALPGEDRQQIAACINADGTVDTYARLSAPEWLHSSSRILRDKIANAIASLPLMLSDLSPGTRFTTKLRPGIVFVFSSYDAETDTATFRAEGDTYDTLLCPCASTIPVTIL